MSHNCNSGDVMAIALTNPPSNSTSNESTHIPFMLKVNVDIGIPTQISNSTSATIINSGTEYVRCVRGCKDMMYRVMKNEPNRVKFQPIKYLGRSSVEKFINENFSEILVDGVPNTHLAICKCKRLIARHFQFGSCVKRHLQTELHLNACPPPPQENKEDTRIDEPPMKILKLESGPRPRSPTPLVISDIESNEQVPTPVKLVPTSTHSIPLSQDFLSRKCKLEELLWIEPPPFVFMPAISLPASIHFTRDVFNEFAIPGYQTDDLFVCTSCVSILNNYPNDIWNVETHAGTYCHFENVEYKRGIQVKNFDFNILKREFH